MKDAPKYYIGIGSNMGDRLNNIQNAILKINEIARVEAVSSIYLTEPVGMNGCENFLNAALAASSPMKPIEMLDELLRIEAELGRVRYPHNIEPSPRTIDLDILLYGQEVMHTQRLVIPHPRLTERLFAMVPLVEMKPTLLHPAFNKPLKEMADDFGDEQQSLVRLGELCWAA